MRKPIIIANWKMYKTKAQCVEFCQNLLPQVKDIQGVDIAVCGAFPLLDTLKENLSGSIVAIGAQNFYPQKEGAFTGEVSIDMLKDCGCQYILIGHSERREIFGESDELIQQKLRFACEHSLKPVLCIGETLEQREAGVSVDVCLSQLNHAVNVLDFQQLSQLIIAYEPIWAIGTGRTATAEDAQTVIGAIRQFVAERYGTLVAMSIRILYGGSVKPDNIGVLMSQEDIDGALVGGASLSSDSFAQLIKGAL